MNISLTPNDSSFPFTGLSSAPWPRSAVKVTTGQSYLFCNHFKIDLY